MLFLVILLIGTATASAALALIHRHSIRDAARLGMAFAMVVAGVSHLATPMPFVQHLPTWVPLREELILVTGLVEIALGLALLLRRSWRRPAGLALAGYLVAVFPSNVYVAVADIDVDGQPGGAYPWIRLPLQVLFIAWALWSTRGGPSTIPATSPGAPADEPADVRAVGSSA